LSKLVKPKTTGSAPFMRNVPGRRAPILVTSRLPI
jgi:hypothetical protein